MAGYSWISLRFPQASRTNVSACNARTCDRSTSSLSKGTDSDLADLTWAVFLAGRKEELKEISMVHLQYYVCLNSLMSSFPKIDLLKSSTFRRKKLWEKIRFQTVVGKRIPSAWSCAVGVSTNVETPSGTNRSCRVPWLAVAMRKSWAARYCNCVKSDMNWHGSKTVEWDSMTRERESLESNGFACCLKALRSKGRGCVICTTVSRASLRHLSLIHGFHENQLKSNRQFISNEHIHEVATELPQDAD